MIKNIAIIDAHGSENRNYVIIVTNFHVTMPAKSGQPLSVDEDYKDNCKLLKNQEGRKFVLEWDDYDYYKHGDVLYECMLDFKTIYSSNKCTKGGIITTLPHNLEWSSISSYENDIKMMESLLENNDDSLFSKKELWNNEYKLSNILDTFIKKKNNFNAAICLICRTNKSNNTPNFLTVKLTKECFSNFYDKLDWMDNCVNKKEYDGFDLNKCSKLRLRLVFSLYSIKIRKLLSKSCSLPSVYFYMIIQIYHGKTIPNKCIAKALNKKLNFLVSYLVSNKDLNVSVLLQNKKINKYPLNKISNIIFSFLETIKDKDITQQSDDLDRIIYVIEQISQNKHILNETFEKIIKL